MSRWQRIIAAPATAGRAIGRGIRTIGRGIGAAVVAVVSAFDLRDAMLFAGIGLLGYGLYDIYPPAAFIVPGAIFVAVATFGAR